MLSILSSCFFNIFSQNVLMWSALIQLDTRTNIEEKTWLESELTGLHHVLWREKSHCVCFRWYCLNYQLRRDGKAKTGWNNSAFLSFSWKTAEVKIQFKMRHAENRHLFSILIAPARKQEPYERHHGQHYQARPPNQLLVLQSHITRHDLLSKTTRYALKYNCLFPLFLCFVLRC